MKKLLFFFTQIGGFCDQTCTEVCDLTNYNASCPANPHARSNFEYVPLARNFFSALWQACFVTSPAFVATLFHFYFITLYEQDCKNKGFTGPPILQKSWVKLVGSG